MKLRSATKSTEKKSTLHDAPSEAGTDDIYSPDYSGDYSGDHSGHHAVARSNVIDAKRRILNRRLRGGLGHQPSGLSGLSALSDLSAPVAQVIDLALCRLSRGSPGGSGSPAK